jgi:peroxiredoxin
LALVLAVAPADQATAQEQVRVAKPAPAFVLKDPAGRDVKLSDFDGQALLVCFWATWDKHSQKQLPVLIALQEEHGENQSVKEFSVIGISVDSGPQSVKTFAEQQKINFPIVMVDRKVIEDFGGLTAVPTTFVIDKNHNIIQKYIGWVEQKDLEADLKVILNK